MVELFVNKQLVDVLEDGIGIRINNKLNDPTKITYNQSEFSYTFSLPTTPNNNRIFGFANVPSARHKFSRRYDALLYADGILLFEGQLKLTTIEGGEYKCNLYTPKNNTLQTIFEETKLNEFEWLVPYEGMTTINEVNNDPTSDYFFPLVSYGLFLKRPEAEDASGYKYYTGKYTIDDTNKFYHNSFVPSLKLSTMLSKMAESKGYTLKGDIMTDPILSNLYLSNHLANEQDPDYNIGNPKLGEIELTMNFKTFNNNVNAFAEPEVAYTMQTIPTEDEDYDGVFAYNLLDTDTNPDHLTVQHNDSLLLIENGIQIPASGWYEIIAEYDMGMAEDAKPIVVLVKGSKITTIDPSTKATPVEWQLLRYTPDDGNVTNISHEPILSAKYNEAENVSLQNDAIETEDIQYYTNIPLGQEENDYCSITAVDIQHNPNFIVGAQQLQLTNTIGYLKNGKSYDVTNETETRNLYNCLAYYKNNGNNTKQIQTADVNKNTLTNATQQRPTFTGQKQTSSGKTHNIIYLNKNEILIPYFNNRAYYCQFSTTSPNPLIRKSRYRSYINLNLKIKAVAKQTTDTNKITANMSTEFNDKLNLANFCNNEEKMTDFFSDVMKAFNLSFTKKGNTIALNKLKKQNKNNAFVNLDELTSPDDAVYSAIDFPSKVTVKFNVNTNEEGLYRSAEKNTTEEQLQSNNWTDYADKGYAPVSVSYSDDSVDIEQSVPFSYCWYENFDCRGFGNSLTINVPVIGLTEWYIEGYKYDEMQLRDGRSLNQRFWFRQEPLENTLDVFKQNPYQITLPIGYKAINNDIVYLNYRDGKNTLLGHFFNINKNIASNQVEVQCYLTAQQYLDIVRGANIKFDDDLYMVNEIKGFDPEGYNMTTLIIQQIN
jgi:hypothetical protein